MGLQQKPPQLTAATAPCSGEREGQVFPVVSSPLAWQLAHSWATAKQVTCTIPSNLNSKLGSRKAQISMKTTPSLERDSAAAVCLAQKALGSVFSTSKEKTSQIREEKIKVVSCSSLCYTEGKDPCKPNFMLLTWGSIRYFPNYPGWARILVEEWVKLHSIGGRRRGHPLAGWGLCK